MEQSLSIHGNTRIANIDGVIRVYNGRDPGKEIAAAVAPVGRRARADGDRAAVRDARAQAYAVLHP